MDSTEIRALLKKSVAYLDYTFDVEAGERMYLQAKYMERDIVTGELEMQFTRKWYVSREATKSEIVQTAFKCCITSAEHRCREDFKYRGRRIFGPHFDVDALHRVCGDREFDYRPAPAEDCSEFKAAEQRSQSQSAADARNET